MRYGVIITQCDDMSDPKAPLHFLRKGTLVRILRPVTYPIGLEVETMYPVFGTMEPYYLHRIQVVDPSDLYEFPACSGRIIESFARVLKSTREFFGIA
ncbi:hypothetical protein [Burkholderia vietnamiensis]|uniref:hypothetical protein n=1 Tax=Burkholderia vietnamiensis TaxID=60552 RepID=UPI00075C1B61|nr:hypothetical protein [Burkholderia vietnamiensis]KVR95824.1 hypothetical protein WK28_01915 [Burkholderia vietnamiensis]